MKYQNVFEKGLTLIEVLVAMGIAAIAGVLLLVIIVNSTGVFYKQSSKVQEGLNINDALAVALGTVKQASAVAVSYTDGSTVYTSGASQLVLKVSSIDPSGSMIPDKYDFFVFYADQKTLHLKVFPDSLSSRTSADRIFSTSVDDLSIQYFGTANPPVEVTPASAKKIRINLKLKQKAGAGFETNSATAEASLRND